MGADPTSPERRKWLHELYAAYRQAVLEFCLGMLGNPDDAADATQETFLRAVQSLTSSGSNPRGWLLVVARNHCRDLLRARRANPDSLLLLGEMASLDGDPLLRVELQELVSVVFRELRPRERIALWRSTVEDRSLSEVANELGLSYCAAAQLLRRARQRAVKGLLTVAGAPDAASAAERAVQALGA